MTYTDELVTYRKYLIKRGFMADGDFYQVPQPFIGFYVDDDSISRRPFNIIFKQVPTGHLVWTHIYNPFYEIKLPYLDQIRNYCKSVPSLQNICKSVISTRDLYLFQKYYF
tara:strand:+ start:1230 stop:1562 length:333 start_codon:yes stop_codon:yes gene_type:complete